MRDRALEHAGDRPVHAALAASIASIAWTGVSSAVAITYGLMSGSVVLIAFGAVGSFDLAGSIALVLHFRHALHHESFSERHEEIAHRIVTFGLSVVGTATLVASILRLVHPGHSNEPLGGLVVASCSIVVLGFLGVRKRRLGQRIGSPALAADGWLSVIGAGTAVCTVVGLILNKSLGWVSADPTAAVAVAAAAIGVAAVNIRTMLKT